MQTPQSELRLLGTGTTSTSSERLFSAFSAYNTSWIVLNRIK
jgi:hypothetical protein